MKYILFLSFQLIAILSFANRKINVYHEQVGNTIEIYADNMEYCPMSIQLKLDLTNMKSSQGNNKLFLVAAQSKKILLTTLTPARKSGKYGFNYEYANNYGDHSVEAHDDDYAYFLPFEKGATYRIDQGYNGQFSHQNEKSLDFNLPEGTHILAARGGTVVEVVERHNRHCSSERCAEYSNHIIIYHEDGTFAMYGHIQQNGARVQAGDQVKKGQLIAQSGNTGWSKGPHLHFTVYYQKMDRVKTVATTFKTEQGLVLLKEKTSYTRTY